MEKRTSLAIVWLLYSWFTNWHQLYNNVSLVLFSTAWFWDLTTQGAIQTIIMDRINPNLVKVCMHWCPFVTDIVACRMLIWRSLLTKGVAQKKKESVILLPCQAVPSCKTHDFWHLDQMNSLPFLLKRRRFIPLGVYWQLNFIHSCLLYLTVQCGSGYVDLLWGSVYSRRGEV